MEKKCHIIILLLTFLVLAKSYSFRTDTQLEDSICSKKTPKNTLEKSTLNKKYISEHTPTEHLQFSGYAPPICTALSFPEDGATNIPVTTNLTWTRVSNATGYRLTVGTTPGGSSILNAINVGNVSNYSFTNKLPEYTNIYVRVTPYNADGNALNCPVQSYTTGPDVPPPTCTTLIYPAPGSTDIEIRPQITWQPVPGIDGYKITIATNPNQTDIIDNEDVGATTSYNLLKDLPNGSNIYISVTPYNLAGDAPNCATSVFTTGASSLRPLCTTLTTPKPLEELVPVDTDLEWEAVPDTNGYIITLETFTDGIDVLNQFDIGNTTLYEVPGDLPENTTMYVTITPYNEYGETENCAVQTFNTGAAGVHYPPKFFTPNNDGVNDFWITPNPINRIERVYIYNRHGKLLKQIKHIASGWDGTFKGQPVPTDDYWYQIIYDDGENLTGHFSLVR